MKFTCESCGAQYMIGDEKLGQRGVKVRCKKCSFVIILRPPGYEPKDPSGATALPTEAPSTRAPTVPSPELRRETEVLPRRQGGASEDLPKVRTGDVENDVVSSDMGLSREFAAMGFEENTAALTPRSDAPRPPSVALDIQKMTSPFPDSTNPFMGGRSGGSLADVPPVPQDDGEEEDDDDDELAATLATRDGPRLPKKAGDLGSAGLPRLKSDDEVFEATNVDNRVPFTPPARAEEMVEADASLGRPLGSATIEPNELAQEPKTIGGAPPAWEDGTESLLRLAESEGEDKPSLLPAPDRVGEGLAALERNELEDMESSLNRALDSGDVQAPRVSAMFGEKDEVTDAERRLPRSGGAALAPRAEAEGLASGSALGEASGGDAPLLDNEIGSAFDAMFGPGDEPVPPPPPPRNGSALTRTPSAPSEVFRSAYKDPDADRRATKVFDLTAMQQVQAEQDLASPRSSPEPEWYVAINDEQVGPMSFEDLRLRWTKGDIGPSSLAWKAGMGDWTAIKGVPELEVLGDMADQIRTVVTQVEATVEPSLAEPPTIAIKEPPGESRPAPMAAAGVVAVESDDEPSWRPSAASALASLAALELGEIPKEKKSDVAVGRALPATSDALEKLLQGDPKASAASPFGAGEQSSSAIRPLPKRAEVVSSIPLRDPVVERSRPSFLMPAVVFAGFALLAGVIYFVLRRDPTPPPAPPVQAAVALAPPAPANLVTTEFKAGGGAVPAAAGAEAAPTPVPAPSPAAAAPPVAPAPAEPKKAEEKAEEPKREAAAREEAPAEEPRRAGRATRAQRARTTEPAPRKVREREPAPVVEKKEEPPPPPKSGDDELLPPARPKRAVAEASSDLPPQLDEADILGVLRKHKAEIRGCVDKQRSADPGLEGTMKVDFVIEGSGKTKRWSVSPDKFRNSVVGKCVVDAVKGWTFRQFTGPAMPVDFPVPVRGG